MTPSPSPSPAVTEYALNSLQFGVVGAALAILVFLVALVAVGVYRK
jgi:hypothetical protein